MLMAMALQFMREHVPSNSRMHTSSPREGSRRTRARSCADGPGGAQPIEYRCCKYLGPPDQYLQARRSLTGTTVEVTDIRSDANIIGNDALAPVGAGKIWRKWAASH